MHTAIARHQTHCFGFDVRFKNCWKMDRLRRLYWNRKWYFMWPWNTTTNKSKLFSQMLPWMLKRGQYLALASIKLKRINFEYVVANKVHGSLSGQEFFLEHKWVKKTQEMWQQLITLLWRYTLWWRFFSIFWQFFWQFDKRSLHVSVCELTPKKETDIKPEGGKGCAYCACDTDTNFVFLPVLFAVGTSSMWLWGHKPCQV